MKILIMSGISPSKLYPFGGVFVSKRYEYLKKRCECTLYKIGREYPKFYKLIHKYILLKGNIEDDQNLIIDDIEWNTIKIKETIIGKIIQKLNISLYYKLYFMIKRKNIEKIILQKYNLIHIHWVYPTGYIGMILSKKYGIPYIVTAHGSDIHTLPKLDKKVLKSTLEVLENAEKVIFVSENLKREAVKLGYSDKNSVVIYNGVDLNKFYPIDENFKKKNLRENKKIGYIGRLDEIKGADRIPEIFNHVNTMNKNIEYVIIGNGSLKDEILERLKKYDVNVKFYSYINQNDLNKNINDLDLIIVPSRKESFCCTALEAQASGVKVVATNIGGIPECVGDYGILVDEGENFEKRFAESILYALKNDISFTNMLDRTKKFSWDCITELEYRLYNDVICKKNNNNNCI